jgi:hypothetical protein
MADFARWATACETAAGFAPGDFMESYNRNRTDAGTLALEGTTLAPLILRLIDSEGEFEGSADQLITKLNYHALDHERRSLPRVPRSMAVALKRIEPGLRNVDIEVSHTRTGKGRSISIRQKPNGETGDAKGDANSEKGDAKPEGQQGAASHGDANVKNDAKTGIPSVEPLMKKREEGLPYRDNDDDIEVPKFASLPSLASYPEKCTQPQGSETVVQREMRRF